MLGTESNGRSSRTGHQIYAGQLCFKSEARRIHQVETVQEAAVLAERGSWQRGSWQRGPSNHRGRVMRVGARLPWHLHQVCWSRQHARKEH